jgi:subtilisin family serine protease
MVKAKHLWSGIIISLWIASFTLYPINSIVSGQVDQPTAEYLPTDTPTITPDISQPNQVVETATSSVTPSQTEILESPTVTNTIQVSESPKVTTRLLVRTTGSYSTERMMAKGEVRNLDPVAIELAKIGVMIVDVPADQVAQIKKDLKSDPDVIFVETDGEVQVLDVIPNDSRFGSQYGLFRIHAPHGWEISTGSPSVTIAIVDSGVDASHPDLAMKMLGGIDFIDGDNIPQDGYGHGTHVAGIAAASTNNGIGVSGVSWGAQILPVRVLDASGDGNYSNLSAGIIWSVDHGAQIINLSLGGTLPNDTLKIAVDYAINHGVMLIAAAGNDASGNLRYPARYPSVIAVGSTNSLDQRSGFSNHGMGLDLVAPGEAIISTIPGGGYGPKDGTSMSAPFVSGLAAILWGMPGMTGPQRIESIMEQSAMDLGAPGWDAEYGFGLIQMDAALLTRINPPRQKSPTHQYAYGYPSNLTPTVTLTPTPTMLHTIVVTPTIPTTMPEVNALTNATSTLIVITPTATPIFETITSSSNSGNPLGSALLLGGGACLLLGGITFFILLVLLKKRNKSSSTYSKDN